LDICPLNEEKNYSSVSCLYIVSSFSYISLKIDLLHSEMSSLCCITCLQIIRWPSEKAVPLPTGHRM